MRRLRSVVFGYHDIGVACLEEMLAAGDDVALVVTHADRPDENVWWRSVRELADKHGLRCLVDPDLGSPDLAAQVRALAPDFIFSFMFRQLLPGQLLEIPRLGALNLHPSALPRYRGRSPINWVLARGEAETGVTLHYMVEKPDRGDIVMQRCFPIAQIDTALTLHRRATDEARLLFRDAYPLLREQRAPRIEQDATQASYFGGRKPEDGAINWAWPARRIYDLVRAVTHPYPGAFTVHDGRRLFVWWARPEEDLVDLAPGQLAVSCTAVRVGTGRGALRLERVQVAGQAERDARDWANTAAIQSGDRLGPRS
ncbi:MAG TPA: formyltransferase [Acidimicrobiia bacterium]|nr:formyltransferase [Acidimicrobiia bacterium]